ncbi:MAG: restriction endonuclease subunit S [Selenomonadaceae bacterium]|nr:restriction endonuclease subunit S [Selenomonadaceae bacterium]
MEKTPEVKSQYYLQSGDVVIADTAEDYTVAKAVELDDVGLCLAGLHTMACRAKSTFAEHFLGHYLNSEHFHFPLMRLMVGTKVISLGKKELSQSVVRIPCLEEQQQIATLFTVLDRRIDLANKKLATLQIIKQGMLQKIFSQELRFKDDEGKEFPAWKTSPLNKLLDFIRNGFVGTILPYYTDAQHGVRYLQGTNIHDGKIDDTVEYYVTQDFNQAHAKNILKSDDILVVQSGHVGDCVVVGDKYVGCNCHALIIMSNGGQCSSEYICYYLHSPKGRKSLKLLEKGNTVKHILATDIAKMNVLVPSLPEQQKIAAYFTALDRAIAAAQQKAAALRTIKRGLLQKMFV